MMIQALFSNNIFRLIVLILDEPQLKDSHYVVVLVYQM